jgi:hypothetical protein
MLIPQAAIEALDERIVGEEDVMVITERRRTPDRRQRAVEVTVERRRADRRRNDITPTLALQGWAEVFFARGGRMKTS